MLEDAKDVMVGLLAISAVLLLCFVTGYAANKVLPVDLHGGNMIVGFLVLLSGSIILVWIGVLGSVIRHPPQDYKAVNKTQQGAPLPKPTPTPPPIK